MSPTGTPRRGRIERAVLGGYGLVRDPELGVVLLRGGLAGEEATFEVERAERGVRFGAVVEILTPSEHRRRAPCASAAACGGCQFQFAAPAGQREEKRAALREALDRAGVTAPVSAWHEGPEFGWRARVGLHVGPDESGGVRVGFHPERSHRVISATACLQVGDRMRSAIRDIERLCGELAPGAASERGIDLVESFDEAVRVVVIDAGGDAPRGYDAAARIAEAARFDGVLERAGRRCRTLTGTPFVTHRIREFALRQHAMSFFQANRALTERLAVRVIESAGAGDVLDLFAGVGLFSIPLAAAGARVRAVEWSAWAVSDLRENAKAAGVAVDALEADVAQGLRAVGRLDSVAVIVDPPRSGLSHEVPSALSDLGAPKVVYVSCDPATLARDIGRFVRHGFAVEMLEGFDLFPTTRHIETLCVLTRR